MTAPLSARDIIAQKASEIGTVPRIELPFVCPRCLGPVVGYAQCHGCSRLFPAAPDSLRTRTIPMSIVSNPSLWYGRLINYKHGSEQDHTLVSALTAAYLTAHESRISDLLAGAISRIAVVPSTRGRTFEVHPLVRAVQRSRLFGGRLAKALVYRQGTTIGRQEYKPSIYSVDARAVEGQRVVVIEDLWVTGAHSVSAAGALLENGAGSVVILPIARVIRPSTLFCPEEYVDQVKLRYDVDSWPR